jgi:branched-chain amino acid transport system substrate-binding protein
LSPGTPVRLSAESLVEAARCETTHAFGGLDMKNVVRILSLVALTACITIVCFTGCRKRDDNVIKIGSVLTLSGSMASYGQGAQKAMELATKEINEKGGINGSTLVILYEDSRTEPRTAASALQKLITVDHLPAVIGDLSSGAVLAMAPIAQRSQVVLLSPGASTPEISDAGDYIFRNWQSDALEGAVDADYAYVGLKWRTVAVLYINNASGAGLNKVFLAHYVGLGGQIIAQESFPQDTTDVRAQISKIAAAKPDGVFMPGYPHEMAVVLKQMKELGISFRILATQAFDDPEILQRVGDAADGVVFSVPKPPDKSDPVVQHFQTAYKNAYGKDPGVCADTSYDAVRIIAQALQKGARTGTEIKDSIKNLRDFPGAAGLTTFDSNGDVLRQFTFLTIKNGAKTNAESQLTP